jgi:hypothetical protein
MPEIWLNYGQNEVALDIQAENLDERMSADSQILQDLKLDEKLQGIDLSKPIEIALLNYTDSVQQVLGKIFEKCKEKSFSKPKILAEKRMMPIIKSNNSEDVTINEFNNDEISDSNLTFLAEMEFDGLFGFETIATRLLKRFGKSQMLDAFNKRTGDTPNSGKETQNVEIARKFVDNFEISSIETVANSKGISDISVGHPKDSISLTKSFANSCVKTVEQQRTMIVSTGKNASNQTLYTSLNSVWNCHEGVKNQGLVILLGECLNGIGSESFQQFIDDRLTIERIKNATKYVNGMENLLYLSEIQKRFQVGLVSILPEVYVKKLGMIPIGGVKKSMDYILKNQSQRQKVQIIEDGARILLRQK